MGHFLHGSHGSWVGECCPMTHHYSTNSVPITFMSTLPLPMRETCHLLRNWSSVHLIGFKLLYMALTLHQHLLYQHLCNRWMTVYWRKFKNMRLSLCRVTLMFLNFDPFHWWGSIANCLTAQDDDWLFQHLQLNAKDIFVHLMHAMLPYNYLTE